MRKRFHPYYLAVLAMATVGLLFSKINKHDFYHHYFKVIEEVETRNSQAIGTAFSFTSLDLREVVRSIANQIGFSFTSSLSCCEALLAPSFSSFPSFQTDISPLIAQRVFLRICPINAP
ncbi:hypothetical protein N9933_02775 [bacterium]|nr:hypothetical protein [bacterium]